MPPPRVPARVSGVDVLSLPLSTTEGFVLSRVDGSTSVDDISMMSGIEKNQLLNILERLAELGAVQLSWYRPQAKPAKLVADKGGAERRREAADSDARPCDAHFDVKPPRYLSSEADAPGEISPAMKVRVLNAYYGIEGLNLYETLGVARDADRKEVRAAYFALSKLFHPDAFFGKQLYDFRPKMEVVFKRLTEAYEVLGKKKKRAEYDEYLGYTEVTQGMQDTLEAAGEAASALRGSSEIPPPPSVPREAEAITSRRGHDSEQAARASARAPRSNAERRARVRDRLRRQLRGASTPPASTASPARRSAPPEAGPARGAEQRQSVAEGLRDSIRASAGARVGSGEARVTRHLERARDAERSGDVLMAASELQLAMALVPTNAELRLEYERVSRLVAAQLAENYEKQARYEEKVGNWKAASSSWGRVADGRPDDPAAACSAAQALLKASGDLHRAQKYAERAVRLAPDVAENLTMLARVYLAAGLKRNARRELEKAAKLDPNNDLVKNLLKDAN